MNRLLFPLLLSGCITLDVLLPFHGNIPCTEVTQETCDIEDPWDAFCDVCEDYEPGPWWTRDYAWREVTLDTLSSIRSIETDFKRVPFTTEDGQYQLDAWFLPSHGEEASLAKTTVVFNHGRKGGIEHYAPRVRFFHELGYNVYIWDYRGYGSSLPVDPAEDPGPPATPDWMTDARQAFLEAQELAPDAEKMIVYGMSVGGMPGGEMADVYDDVTCANMFEASFNSISSKVETNLALSIPGSHITSGLIENEVKLSDATTPTLIMHGTLDDRIHLDEAKTLYDALPEDLPKEWVVFEGAGHGLGKEGGVPEQGLGAYGAILKSFLEDKAPDCLEI